MHRTIITSPAGGVNPVDLYTFLNFIYWSICSSVLMISGCYLLCIVRQQILCRKIYGLCRTLSSSCSLLLLQAQHQPHRAGWRSADPECNVSIHVSVTWVCHFIKINLSYLNHSLRLVVALHMIVYIFSWQLTTMRDQPSWRKHKWECQYTVKLIYNDHPWDQKMWSLYTGGLYMQVQLHGMYTPGYL